MGYGTSFSFQQLPEATFLLAGKYSKSGAHFANPRFTQIHPTCIPVSGDHQSKDLDNEFYEMTDDGAKKH